MDSKFFAARKVAVIRNGLVLAVTTPSGALRVPTSDDIEDHLVVIESKDGPAGWLVISRSTGCPPNGAFVPAIRLQAEDSNHCDELGDALLCVHRAA